MEWKDIEAVNKELKTVPIKGKKYVMVKDKVLGLRAIEPNASINTEILEFSGEQIIVKATIYVDGVQVGSGIAEERKGSSTINSTSFVENCETSAIGRALSSMGIGAEDSYASGEEVATAIMNQGKKSADKEMLDSLQRILNTINTTDKDFWKDIKAMFSIEKLSDINDKETLDEITRLSHTKLRELEADNE